MLQKYDKYYKSATNMTEVLQDITNIYQIYDDLVTFMPIPAQKRA